MQTFKKRIFGKETTIAEEGNFGYTNTLTSACGLPETVTAYRNVMFGAFENATILATNIELTTFAPAGYYSEYSTVNDTVISRHWNGTAFDGSPELCA